MKRKSDLSEQRLNPKESNSHWNARDKRRRSSRERRGIGAIIGGTILAAIIFTSFFTYFMTVMQSQTEKGKVDMLSSGAEEERKIETFKVNSASCPDPCAALPVIVNNTGPIPMNASFAVAFPADDPESRTATQLHLLGSAVTDQVLNPGESAVFAVPVQGGSVDTSKEYHVDIISSRGNIMSVQWVPDQTEGSGSGGGSGTNGVGQNNTGVNIGTGDAAIYAGMSGTQLQFKRLVQGAGITITNSSSTITIASVNGASGNGEVNDGQNRGCSQTSPLPANCANIYENKVSTHLQFNSLKGGTGITLTPDGNGNWIIDATTLGTVTSVQNIGSGSGYVYKDQTNGVINLRTLQGSGGTGVTTDGDVVTITSADTEIGQGTGSLQLDFKSFGLIFPNFVTRNGVDQTGWLTKSANATGYPAFVIPAGPKVYLTDRIRNLDAQGHAIELGRSSSLQLSLGNCNGANSCAPIFLCKSNIAAHTVSALTDPPGISISATPQSAAKTVGWQELVFCSNAQASTTQWWVKASMQSPINSMFMVARGIYGGTSFSYAQTIPYQATYLAHEGANNAFNSAPGNPNMVGCLLSVASAADSICPSDPTAGADPANAKYQGTAGQTVYVHVNPISSCADTACGTSYNVVWVYPTTGNAQNLATGVTLSSGARNIPITIPSVTAGYYTIMLTTGYSTANLSAQDVYYFTFKVN